MIAVPAYTTASDELLHPARGKTPADFFVGWGADDFADTALLCAELCRLAYGDEALVGDSLPQAGLRLLKWIGGTSLDQRARSWGTDGFVAGAGDDRIFVVFRGTEGDRIEDVVADLRTDDCAWVVGGKVHEGFAAAFGAIAAELDTALAAQPAGLILAGHSLGAAIATLAASTYRERAPQLFTYGSPRVGNADFLATMEGVQHRRHVDCCDVVTRVPPERFEFSDVSAILAPFFGDGLANQLAASALATALAFPLKFLLGDPRFEHHGTLVYLTRDRKVLEAPEQALIDSDQAAARRDYGQSPAPSDRAPATGGDPLERAIAQWRHKLNLDGAGLRVPFRDLADHAPLNYLAALAAQRLGAHLAGGDA